MFDDVECPYCGKGQEIIHDDGYGYEEDRIFEQDCDDCEKTFVYTTSISFYYEANKADCLNGEDHRLEPVTHCPRYWPDWRRCKDCSYEERGEYTPVREGEADG